MNKKTARIALNQNKASGSETPLEWKRSSWTSLPRDDVYEQRIFDLECYIQQLETLLMIAESEKNQKNKKYSA